MNNYKVLIFSLFLLLSNCSTIRNNQHMSITLNVDEHDEIVLDGRILKKSKNEYLIDSKSCPNQVTIVSDGFKDDHSVLVPYKNTVVQMNDDKDSGNSGEDTEINLKYRKLFIDSESLKNIGFVFNKVNDQVNDNLYYQRFNSLHDYSYGMFDVDNDVKEPLININVKEMPFALNNLLNDFDCLDTSKVISNRLFLNAEIIKCTNFHVLVKKSRGFKNQIVSSELRVKWEVLDNYKNSLYSNTEYSMSGDFLVQGDSNIISGFSRSIEDSMKIGLIKFMNSQGLKRMLLEYNLDASKRSSISNLVLDNSTHYVSNLKEAIKSTLTVMTKAGFGSGFFISSDGYILTNYHVVSDDIDGVDVILNDGSKYKAVIVRINKLYDLALLKIDIADVLPFRLKDTSEIEIGADVYAVGTPTAEDLFQTVSKGIVSGIRGHKNDNSKLIQTDASVNSGNSGGPLLLKNGLVVGIVSSKITGVGIEGVAFGIPANEVFEKLNIEIQK